MLPSQYATTRISEHQKKDTQVSRNPFEGCGSTSSFEWKFQDAGRTVEKSWSSKMYTPASSNRPNARNKNQGLELTLTYYSKWWFDWIEG